MTEKLMRGENPFKWNVNMASPDIDTRIKAWQKLGVSLSKRDMGYISSMNPDPRSTKFNTDKGNKISKKLLKELYADKKINKQTFTVLLVNLATVNATATFVTVIRSLATGAVGSLVFTGGMLIVNEILKTDFGQDLSRGIGYVSTELGLFKVVYTAEQGYNRMTNVVDSWKSKDFDYRNSSIFKDSSSGAYML
jgi:hypothetical protein